jgi:hypothetical protein
MLVGVTFFCTAYVQSQRGHIGIEAMAGLLPPRECGAPASGGPGVGLFCAFFTWKSWALFHEAWVDGQTTSSTFAPPLWIPYSMMALGMSLLTLQLLLQTLARLTNKPEVQHESADLGRAVRRGHAGGDVLRHADRLRAGRGGDRLHVLLHAGIVAGHHHPERLRRDGQHHPAVDSAVHPEGRGHRQIPAGRTCIRPSTPG